MAGILVTGITGNIGNELSRLLIKEQVPFRAVARDPHRARQMLGETTEGKVEIVTGDYTNRASLEKAMEGIDTLFLISANPALELHVVEAAKKMSIKRIVKSSAIGFKDKPPVGHKQVEEIIINSAIPFTILRPNAFMQTFAQYLPKLIDEKGYFQLPAGKGKIAWIDSRDIAAVAAKVLLQETHEGKIYILSGPQALSMDQIAELLSQITGKPIHYKDVSPQQARENLLKRGMAPMADFLIDHYTAVQRGGFEQVTDTVAFVSGNEPRSFTAFATENRSLWHLS